MLRWTSWRFQHFHSLSGCSSLSVVPRSSLDFPCPPPASRGAQGLVVEPAPLRDTHPHATALCAPGPCLYSDGLAHSLSYLAPDSSSLCNSVQTVDADAATALQRPLCDQPLDTPSATAATVTQAPVPADTDVQAWHSKVEELVNNTQASRGAACRFSETSGHPHLLAGAVSALQCKKLLPASGCKLHSSAHNRSGSQTSSDGSWQSASNTPPWVPAESYGPIGLINSTPLFAAIDIATAFVDGKSGIHDADAAKLVCEALSVTSPLALQNLQDGGLTEKKWMEGMTAMCSTMEANLISDRTAVEANLQKLSAMAHSFSLLPWCLPFQSFCQSALAKVDLHLNVLGISELCDVADALVHASIQNVSVEDHILSSVSLEAPTMSSSDLLRAAAALLRLSAADSAESCKQLLDLLNSFVQVDSALSHESVFRLCSVLHRTHPMCGELAAFQCLASAAVSELSGRVSHLFPQLWMFEALQMCLVFTPRGCESVADLARVLWHVVPGHAMSLSSDQLHLVLQVVRHGDLSVDFLHPHVYASVLRLIVHGVCSLPVQQLVQYLHLFRKCKVMNHRTAAFVMEQLFPRLPYLTPSEIWQLLAELQWIGCDTRLSSSASKPATHHTAIYSQWLSWLPRSECEQSKVVRLFLAFLRPREKEFSTQDLNFIVFYLSRLGCVDQHLSERLVARPIEGDWQQSFHLLCILSEAMYRGVCVSGTETLVEHLHSSLIAALESDFSSSKFKELSDLLLLWVLRDLPFLDSLHYLMDSLSVFINRASTVDAQNSDVELDCAAGLDVAWRCVHSLDNLAQNRLSPVDIKPQNHIRRFFRDLAAVGQPPAVNLALTPPNVFQEQAVATLVRLNSRFASFLDCSQVTAIVHVMLDLAHSCAIANEQGKNQLLHQAAQLVVDARSALLASARHCQLAPLAAFVDVLYSLKELGRMGKVQYTADGVLYHKVCKQAQNLFNSGSCALSPARTLNMFFVLASMGYPKSVFWTVFDRVATANLTHVTPAVAVQLGDMFIAKQCISSAFVEELIGLLNTSGLESLHASQVMAVSRILLSHFCPSPRHLALVDRAVLSALESSDVDITLKHVATCLTHFTSALYVPDPDLTKALEKHLESLAERELSLTQQADLLDCLPFFVNLSYPLGQLAGIARGFVCGMLSNANDLDVSSCRAMPKWLLSLAEAGQEVSEEDVCIFLQDKRFVSALTKEPVQSQVWGSVLALCTTTLSPQSRSKLRDSTFLDSVGERMVLSQIMSVIADFALLKIHLKSDYSLQSLQYTLLEFIKDPSLVEQDVVDGNLVPVWRAFYLDKDGSFCDPVSLGTLEPASVVADLVPGFQQQSTGAAALPSPVSERSSEHDSHIDASTLPSVSGGDKSAVFDKVRFARTAAAGGVKCAVLPLRPGKETMLGSGHLSLASKTHQKQLEESGWAVLVVSLENWSKLSTRDRKALIAKFVLQTASQKCALLAT